MVGNNLGATLKPERVLNVLMFGQQQAWSCMAQYIEQDTDSSRIGGLMVGGDAQMQKKSQFHKI